MVKTNDILNTINDTLNDSDVLFNSLMENNPEFILTEFEALKRQKGLDSNVDFETLDFSANITSKISPEAWLDLYEKDVPDEKQNTNIEDNVLTLISNHTEHLNLDLDIYVPFISDEDSNKLESIISDFLLNPKAFMETEHKYSLLRNVQEQLSTLNYPQSLAVEDVYDVEINTSTNTVLDEIIENFKNRYPSFDAVKERLGSSTIKNVISNKLLEYTKVIVNEERVKEIIAESDDIAQSSYAYSQFFEVDSDWFNWEDFIDTAKDILEEEIKEDIEIQIDNKLNATLFSEEAINDFIEDDDNIEYETTPPTDYSIIERESLNLINSKEIISDEQFKALVLDTGALEERLEACGEFYAIDGGSNQFSIIPIAKDEALNEFSRENKESYQDYEDWED